jgi:hypothetical protein
MAGFRLPHQDIAPVLETSRTALEKAFREDLAAAKIKVQSTILTKSYEALEAGSWWAIHMHTLGSHIKAVGLCTISISKPLPRWTSGCIAYPPIIHWLVKLAACRTHLSDGHQPITYL